MNLKKLVIAIAVIFSSQSFAHHSESIRSLSQEDSSMNLAQVQKQFVLKTPTEMGDTRISLLVMDMGGSTDVSPNLGLYLIYFQDGEESNASAVFPLGYTFQLTDFSDNGGKGHLEMKLKQLGDNGWEYENVVIDYEKFNSVFEAAAESVEVPFYDEWVDGTITKTIK